MNSVITPFEASEFFFFFFCTKKITEDYRIFLPHEYEATRAACCLRRGLTNPFGTCLYLGCSMATTKIDVCSIGIIRSNADCLLGYW